MKNRFVTADNMVLREIRIHFQQDTVSTKLFIPVRQWLNHCRSDGIADEVTMITQFTVSKFLVLDDS